MPSRESRSRVHRRVIRRRRQVVGGGLLLFVALLVLAGVRLAAALSGTPVATATRTVPVSVPVRVMTPMPTNQTLGTGEYERAPGGTDRQGSGPLRTYRVEVEIGTGQDAQAFATGVPLRAAASRTPASTRRATNSSSPPPTTWRRRLITRRCTRERDSREGMPQAIAGRQPTRSAHRGHAHLGQQRDRL